MIINKPDSHFIFVFPTDHINGRYNYINYQGKALTNKEYLEHWGKFVSFGSPKEIDAIARALDTYVEQKVIPCIKYDRSPVTDLGLTECVLCVYCDDRQKNDVWAILKEHGVYIKAWVYERETVEKWSPGGMLLEKWIASHNLSEFQAEQVREGARRKFREMFKYPELTFRGIEQ
ncbi:MAG: hypothetical protein WC364_09885 [Eubacteriales bacterium]|jgi:hypothetical protein